MITSNVWIISKSNPNLTFGSESEVAERVGGFQRKGLFTLEKENHHFSYCKSSFSCPAGTSPNA